MTSVEPSPTTRRCANCGSYQVVEKEGDGSSNTFVVLKLHCNMCREDVIFWTGTRTELTIYRRKKRILNRALRRFGNGTS